MANTVLIKWGTGELELDMPCFIDDMPDIRLGNYPRN